MNEKQFVFERCLNKSAFKKCLIRGGVIHNNCYLDGWGKSFYAELLIC